MPYSADALNRLVEQYISSADGKKLLEEKGIATRFDAMKKIGVQLKNDIIDAFLSIVKDQEAKDAFYGAYAQRLITVSSPEVYGKAGKEAYRVSINFDDEVLRRPSLFTDSNLKHQTGDGIDDIFELFTNGARFYPYYRYGFWYSPDGYGDYSDGGHSGYVRTVRSRKANNFINKVMAKYEAVYPQIEFKWPEKWGYKETI